MNKWIAEFDLEDGDTMPEHMDLNYMGAKIDFHCRPMWIPISERLPENDSFYLVTEKSGRVCTYVFHKGNSEEYWKRCAVAWMPLPKPFKVENEEVSMKKYTFSYSGDITVKAETEEEARELADELVAPTAYTADNCEDISVYELELKETEEA